MNPVDGGAGDQHHPGPPADGEQLPAGGNENTADSGRRGLLDSPRVRIGALAFGALGAGLLVGGLVFGGGGAGTEDSSPEVAAPTPTATVNDDATRSADDIVAAPPPAVAPVGTLPDLTRLVIPALDIDQGVIDLGVAPDGAMDVPDTASEIGWWADGPAPGEAGGSLIAAHVNLDGDDGVFSELGSMEVGQEVVVEREDGTSATYQVTSIEQFPKDDFPDARVYTYEGPTRLHLVTCGGVFDRGTGHYDDNIVVFADLVSDTRSPAGA